MNIPDEYEKFRRRTAETHVGDSLEQRIAFSEGCRAGMLAAADIVGNLQKDYAHEVAINLALGYIERAREAAE